MKMSRQRERQLVHQVLQDASDRLTAGIPDVVRIGISEEEIMFDCTTWSSALTRVHFSGETARRQLSLPEWRSEAEDEITLLFGEAIACLEDRWASARALGLVRGRECRDLAPGEMMIDRILLRLLDEKRVDVRDAAARIASCAPGTRVNNSSGAVGLRVGHGDIVAFHEGLGPPVIRTSVPIGVAEFDGASLVVCDRLPDSIMNASAGRPLGAIVSTGLTDLDDRLIATVEAAERKPYGQAFEKLTVFRLAPDLVKLGSGRAARHRPCGVRRRPD